MASLEIQLPSGETVEMDIGQMTPDDPRVSAMLQEIQRRHAPTPLQQLSTAVGGPLGEARDRLTQTVASGLGAGAPTGGGGATGVMGADSPAMQSVQQVQAPIAQSVAQGLVPQNLPQLAATVAMGGVSGAGTGVGGMFARTILPAMAQALTGVVMEDEPGQERALTEALIMAATSVPIEGAGAVFRALKKIHLTQDTRDKIGNATAAWIGQNVAQMTSVKNMKTPYAFQRMVEDVVENRMQNTLFYKQAQETIEASEQEIRKMITPGLGALPPPRRAAAEGLLDEAAGFTKEKAGQAGSNLIHGAPDTLFEKALQRARSQFQLAGHLEGAEKFAALQEYGRIREQIETALQAIDPALHSQYLQMNKQFAADVDVLKMLWTMKEKGAWKSDTKGTHFNESVAADIIEKASRHLEDTGFLGGVDDAMKRLAGASNLPGARATIHEGYSRMFMNPWLSPISLSTAYQPEMLVTPQATTTGRAMALSEFMGTKAIQGMAGTGEER